VKLVRLRRPKVICSPSYVGYRLKTNAAILLDRSHTKGKLHMGGIGEGKETKNLNVVDMPSVQREYSNLKLAKAIKGMEIGSNEED
jgi:hypothetical protein